VKQDRQRAFELYMKAADQGNPQAMFNIAVVYGAGQLRDPNLGQAYVWLLRAKRYRTNCFSRDAKTDDRVNEAIRYTERKLSSEEQERARHAAEDWSPKSACH
jgi:TPR repeat protein